MEQRPRGQEGSVALDGACVIFKVAVHPLDGGAWQRRPIPSELDALKVECVSAGAEELAEDL